MDEPVKHLPSFGASILGNIIFFAAGNAAAWLSPVSLILEGTAGKESPLDKVPSVLDLSLIGSFLSLGALLTPLAAAYLSDRIGRKMTCLISSGFFIIAYILMLVGKAPAVIMVGRLCQGAGVGIVWSAMPVYVAEIASDKVRGAVCSFMNLFFVSGILFIYCVGPFISYMALQYVCLAVPIIFIVCFTFMPESPYFYGRTEKTSRIVKSLKFLRGQSEKGVQNEAEQIQKDVNEDMALKKNLMDIIKIPSNRKALIMSVGLIIIQNLSGIDAVVFYNQKIFKLADMQLQSEYCSIIMSCLQVCTAIAVPFFIDRIGRKTILVITTSVMAASFAALSIAFCVIAAQGSSPKISWLPLPALILFIVAFTAGMGPIPWVFVSEVFPNDMRAFASAIAAILAWGLSFISLMFFTLASHTIGVCPVFWIYTAVSFSGIFFIYFVLIETKGKSFQQIQKDLGRKSVES